MVALLQTVGVVGLLISGLLSVCQVVVPAAHPAVTNRQGCWTERTAEKKELDMTVLQMTLPASNFAYIFLKPYVSTFSRCIQMLLVMCNPLQVRVNECTVKKKKTSSTVVIQTPAIC